MEYDRQWRNKLEQILQSSDVPARELIAAIRDLGAEMGSDNGRALLDAYPDIVTVHREALKNAFSKYVVENERLQTQQLLQQEWNGSTSFPELANPLSSRVYSRSIDMFEHIDFKNCRQMVLVGSGWMPVTLFHVQDMTDVPELLGIDLCRGRGRNLERAGETLRLSAREKRTARRLFIRLPTISDCLCRWDGHV